MEWLNHRKCIFEGFWYMFIKIIFYKAYSSWYSYQQSKREGGSTSTACQIVAQMKTQCCLGHQLDLQGFAVSCKECLTFQAQHFVFNTDWQLPLGFTIYFWSVGYIINPCYWSGMKQDYSTRTVVSYEMKPQILAPRRSKLKMLIGMMSFSQRHHKSQNRAQTQHERQQKWKNNNYCKGYGWISWSLSISHVYTHPLSKRKLLYLFSLLVVLGLSFFCQYPSPKIQQLSLSYHFRVYEFM